MTVIGRRHNRNKLEDILESRQRMQCADESQFEHMHRKQLPKRALSANHSFVRLITVVVSLSSSLTSSRSACFLADWFPFLLLRRESSNCDVGCSKERATTCDRRAVCRSPMLRENALSCWDWPSMDDDTQMTISSRSVTIRLPVLLSSNDVDAEDWNKVDGQSATTTTDRFANWHSEVVHLGRWRRGR